MFLACTQTLVSTNAMCTNISDAHCCYKMASFGLTSNFNSRRQKACNKLLNLAFTDRSGLIYINLRTNWKIYSHVYMCFTVRRICALNLKSWDFSKCIKHLNRLNHRQIHPEIVKEKVVIFDGNKRPLSSPFYMPLILVCLLSLLGLLYHFSSPILIVCMLVSLMKLQAQQYILLSPLSSRSPNEQ